MGKLVAVTGATGFVGPHLVAALARRGWRLRLLVRRWSPLPSLAGVDADLVLGDRFPSRPAPAGRRGGCGGPCRRADQGEGRPGLPAGQPGQCGAPVGACPDAHMVLLSSLAAREPQLSAYGASKRAGEAVVANRSGPWTIVRAPAVYGPGDRETLAYFRAVKLGIAPQPRLPAARLSLIHVSDLAEALTLSVERPPRIRSTKSTTGGPTPMATWPRRRARRWAGGRGGSGAPASWPVSPGGTSCGRRWGPAPRS